MERTSKKTKKAKKLKKEEVKTPQRGKAIKEQKTTKETGLLRFRKVGAGVFRHQGHIYKENEVFYSTFEAIPKAFRNQVICLDQKELIASKKVTGEDIKEDFSTFIKVKTTGGLYNIINNSGKVMNEEPLTEEAADKLVTILNQ